MKKILFLILTSLLAYSCFSQEIDSNQVMVSMIENSLKYETGTIELPEGNATMNIPKGFRFLNKEQSMYVLTELWGNPPDSSVMGMLVLEKGGIFDSWVFTVSYDPMGYVKDDDAQDIDYDELLKEQQKDFQDENPERIQQGYQPIEFIGWAEKPYYDTDKKILHWAKELRFGDDSVNTLNYNLRILGRKGVFMLNAIATIQDLNDVNANLNTVLESVTFKEGSTYADFNPEIDDVAAWTIGGLVAGKILAKVGFFAVLLKFWKIIGIAIIGGASAFWKFIKGRKKDEHDSPRMHPK